MTTVETVTGPITPDQLGLTLTHEHIFNDVRSWHQPTHQRGWDPEDFAQRPVTTDILWDLKQDPFGNLDNCALQDDELAAAEVVHFAKFGGRTIMEATGTSIGRDLARLAAISRRTGVQIVAGAGFYLESSQDEETRASGVEMLASRILTDLTEGVDGIRPGMIGEIGVSADFTPAERRSLEAACIAQVATGLPMQVHLPGWFRRGHEVLDLAEAAGVELGKVVLCHMNPSIADGSYQRSLADRGAFIQFDMIGMEVFYADQDVQCPSDEETATAIIALIADGYRNHILMSHDIFLKSLLRAYGGPGYAHIPQYFVPRLERLGATTADISHLLIDNPRALFLPVDERSS